MTTLRAGQRVIVSGPLGTVAGDVLNVETPDTLPELVGTARVARVREILAEFDVVEIALIRHLHNGRPVVFAALRDSEGQWRDLRGQQLTIAPDLGCRYCNEGNPAVRSSVVVEFPARRAGGLPIPGSLIGRPVYVHTDTPSGRVVCTQARRAS